MNIRSLYRLSLAIESLLDDIVVGNINDENQVLEILLDTKRLTDLLSQELNNYIMKVAKG